MKRILASALSVIVLLALLPVGRINADYRVDGFDSLALVGLDTPILMGDITADETLNMGDVGKLYAYVRGAVQLTEDALLCADMNADEKINMGDVGKLYAYIRGTDPAAIVDTAYQLSENQEMSLDCTLRGKVISVLEPYNANYGCITVGIVVAGRDNFPIICSRLMGEDTASVGVNDKITVTGRLRNFYGSVEFKEGCRLTEWTDVPTPEEAMAQIVDAAYALAVNESMDHTETLTGKVVSLDQAYSTGLPYISVTMVVAGREDKPVSCYRMVGTEIANVKIGDTVTVTGTLRNFYGTVEFKEGCQLDGYVPGNIGIVVETDPIRIVDVAYALKTNEQMTYDVTISGKVCQIEDAYSAQYKNITLMIQVKGRESKPLLIYRLKGDGVDKIAVNDTITVVGRIMNYEGKVGLYNGTMTNRVSGGGTVIKQETDPAKIMAAAKQLPENNEMTYDVTLSGKVVSFEKAYDSEYKNVSVIISVSGTSDNLLLYRMTGTDIDKLAVGDTITVKGRIRNHYGTIELTYGEMTKRTSGGDTPPVGQTDYTKIVDEAYALAAGASLAYTATLEGKIVELQSPYDSTYKNMTVVIAVVGRESKPIVCYRMKGDDIGNHLCVDDTITVEGKIENYNGTIEFDSGCQMTARKAGSVSKPTDPKKIVDAAFALGKNEVLPYFATLTGTVKAITEAYTEQYKNVTLTITVEGTNGTKDIVCYRLKGEAAATVAVGNTITVTGAIKNYVGTDKETGAEKPPMVEFDSGCILESLQR